MLQRNYRVIKIVRHISRNQRRIYINISKIHIFLLQVLYTTMIMVHFSIQLENSPVKIE